MDGTPHLSGIEAVAPGMVGMEDRGVLTVVGEVFAAEVYAAEAEPPRDLRAQLGVGRETLVKAIAAICHFLKGKASTAVEACRDVELPKFEWGLVRGSEESLIAIGERFLAKGFGCGLLHEVIAVGRRDAQAA